MTRRVYVRLLTLGISGFICKSLGRGAINQENYQFNFHELEELVD